MYDVLKELSKCMFSIIPSVCFDNNPNFLKEIQSIVIPAIAFKLEIVLILMLRSKIIFRIKKW